MCDYFPKLKTHFFVVQIFAAISVASSMQEDIYIYIYTESYSDQIQEVLKIKIREQRFFSNKKTTRIL